MFTLAALHANQQIGWTQWTIHPSTVVGLAALGGLYLWRARQLEQPADRAVGRSGTTSGDHAVAPPVSTRSPGRPIGVSPTGPQRLSFFSALLVVFLALNGPLHDLSDSYLFSAHMVQHLLLTLAFPPLLLMGLTGEMLAPLLRAPVVGGVLRTVTRPTWCFALFNLVLAAWHLPPLYNTAMAHHSVHILQHLMFMAGSVLMWWPILSPVPELPRLPYPGQLLYLFLMSIPMSIVSVYIVYAGNILYPAYASAPRVWNITPLEDQQIGGLIMWIPGGLFFLLLMSVIFFKWAGRYDETGAGGTEDGRLAPRGA